MAETCIKVQNRPIIIKTLLYSQRRRYLLLVISSLLPIWDYALSDMAYSHVYGIFRASKMCSRKKKSPKGAI
jgi:hypothetical protein